MGDTVVQRLALVASQQEGCGLDNSGLDFILSLSAWVHLFNYQHTLSQMLSTAYWRSVSIERLSTSVPLQMANNEAHDEQTGAGIKPEATSSGGGRLVSTCTATLQVTLLQKSPVWPMVQKSQDDAASTVHHRWLAPNDNPMSDRLRFCSGFRTR